jgi:arsenic resistance protein ArsH
MNEVFSANSLPNVANELFQIPNAEALGTPLRSTHPPRILLLYGSLRERSFSRLLTEEAARLLCRMGAETHTFDPHGLPLPDDAPTTHPKVQELRELAQWAEGMVWCSPERHGAMTGIIKAQIDWIPLADGAVRPTQGKTLAVMQVSGGSQSFNAVNQLRVLGRWMRMITIPNQSSVAQAFAEFDEAGRMKPSAYCDRVVDVMEELIKFTLLTRDVSSYLVDRYSERKESAAELSKRVNQKYQLSGACTSSGGSTTVTEPVALATEGK